MRNDLIMNYRIDKSKIVVIYNPAIITVKDNSRCFNQRDLVVLIEIINNKVRACAFKNIPHLAASTKFYRCNDTT